MQCAITGTFNATLMCRAFSAVETPHATNSDNLRVLPLLSVSRTDVTACQLFAAELMCWRMQCYTDLGTHTVRCCAPRSCHPSFGWCCLQMLLVVWTWLIAVPLGTCCMWRLSFVASLEGAVTMLASRMQPVYIVADCLQVRCLPSLL